MDAKDYKVRCDKCQFKPYVYCEMCMVRTKLQDAIDKNRDMTESACASMQLAINVIHDLLELHQNQIDLIKGFMNI